jgi:hypothetical protein
MTPLLIPISIFGFLGGAALGRSRRGLSMLPPDRLSPLYGVPSAKWERFVSVMVVSPRNTRTPRGRWGMFGMDARCLSDVGFMTKARKSVIGSEIGVWSGEWVAPLDATKFLSSSPAQYEAFSRSMRRLAPAMAKHVGSPVEGGRASLSGLLAVGHLAGVSGAESWVSDPATRQKFKATTANFERANGIF